MKRIPFSLLILTGLVAAPAVAAIDFLVAPDFQTGLGPWGIAVGDVDGDGFPDVVTADLVDQRESTVSVLRNKGDGTFAAPVSYPVEAAARSVALGDFNGDQKLDLVVANYLSHAVSVLRNKGDATVASAGAHGTGPVVERLSGPHSRSMAEVSRNSCSAPA